jgi:hypothetical protein
MLLDEADVFLARRHLNDLNRNSLVSGELCHQYYITFLTCCGCVANLPLVFLRVLEYYNGS